MFLGPRKRRSDVDRADGTPLLQLGIRVQIVLGRVPTAIEQQHLPDVPPSAALDLRRALLDEPAHGREPRSGAEQDERHARVGGERERRRGRADGDLHEVPRAERGQKVGRDTQEVGPRPRERGRRHDRDGEGAVARVPERRGRDGVLPHAHGGQHVDKCTEGDRQRGVGHEDVEYAETFVDDCCLVILDQVFDGGFDRPVRRF